MFPVPRHNLTEPQYKSAVFACWVRGEGGGGVRGGGTEYLWLQLKQLAGNIDSICHAFLHQRGERGKIIGGAKDDCH